MLQAPAEFADWLTSAGLPLGPFAGPLRYHRKGTGALHSRDSCAALRGGSEPVDLPAADIPVGKLCARCGTSFPAPAEDWAAVCRQIAMARRDAAAPVTGSWRRVTELDNSQWTLAWFDRHRTSEEMRELLGPELAATYRTLADARAAETAVAPDDLDVITAAARRRGLLPGTEAGRRPHLVAMMPITSVTMLHMWSATGRTPLGLAELLAHLQITVAGDLGMRGGAGVAVAPAAVAALLAADTPIPTDQFDVHDLGPAEAGDTAEILATAAWLFTEAYLAMFPGPRLVEQTCAGVLNAARGVHADA